MRQRDDLGFLAAVFGAEPFEREVVVVDDGRDGAQLVGLSGCGSVDSPELVITLPSSETVPSLCKTPVPIVSIMISIDFFLALS